MSPSPLAVRLESLAWDEERIAAQLPATLRRPIFDPERQRELERLVFAAESVRDAHAIYAAEALKGGES